MIIWQGRVDDMPNNSNMFLDSHWKESFKVSILGKERIFTPRVPIAQSKSAQISVYGLIVFAGLDSKDPKTLGPCYKFRT